MMKKFLVCALAAWAGAGALAYEYDVSEPKIRPQFKGAEAGVWTLDRAAAFAQAKAEGMKVLSHDNRFPGYGDFVIAV